MAAALRVLITRPSHQAQALTDAVSAAGHTPLRCPTIVIEPVPLAPDSDPTQDPCGTCDIAIFVSANAVSCANQAVNLNSALANAQAILAIGPATAHALHDVGIDVTPLVGERFDSEHLLNQPALQAIAGLNVWLFRGAGGRDAIARTVLARAAKLTQLVVYRRRAPTDTEFEHSQHLIQQADVILSGSDEALDNLVTLAPDSIRTRLLRTALVVNSERGKTHAIERGFSGQISVAQPAGDDGQLDALTRIAP